MAYHSLKTADSDLASNDDLTVFGAGPDTPLHRRGAWFLPKSRRWLKTALQAFIALEAILIFTLTATNLVTLRALMRQQEILNAQHSTGNAHSWPTTYSRDRRFMTLDPQYDHLWEEWTASAQIMVPSEIPGEGDVQGAYSMFHQMHCLASFRKAIQTARAGEDPGFDYWDNGHWPHCFDYMRNSILCWADDNIEIPMVVEGERLPFIDGTRTMRQCRSTEIMYEKMRIEEQRVERANKDDRQGQAHRHRRPHSLNQTKDDMLVWGGDGNGKQTKEE